MAKKTITAGSTADKILQELKQVRKDLDYTSCVMRILEISGYKIKSSISSDSSKRFLTGLVSATPISPQGELKKRIALMSFALLNDKDVVWSTKVAERRQQFVSAYNYKGLTGTSKDPADLNHTEDSIYKAIVEYYEKSLIKNRQFFLDAFGGTLPDGMVINAPVPINNLPIEFRGFVGREGYLEKLHEGFAVNSNDGSRNNSDYSSSIIQILHGMGGTGKTEIAKKYAYGHIGEYRAIIWIDFTSDETIFSSITEFLMRRTKAETAPTSAEQARFQLLNYLAQVTRYLMILDNVDYLDEDKEKEDAQVRRLQSYLPNRGGHIIITTRCNSELMGATRIKVTGFNNEEIEACFVNKVAGYVADEEDEKLVLRIRNFAYGLPLALSIFADTISERGISYFKQNERYLTDILLNEKLVGRKSLSETLMPMFSKLSGEYGAVVTARNVLIRLAYIGVHFPQAENKREVIEKSFALIDDCCPEVINADDEYKYAINKMNADTMNILAKYSFFDYYGVHPIIEALAYRYYIKESDRD